MLFTYRHSGQDEGTHWYDQSLVEKMEASEADEFLSWKLHYLGWIHATSKNVIMDEKYDIRNELGKVAAVTNYENEYGEALTRRFQNRMATLELEIADLADVKTASMVELREYKEKQLARKKEQNIYIARFGKNVVKVGVSVNVEQRLKAHEKSTRHRANLLEMFPGDEYTESAICNFLYLNVAKTLHGNEWFPAAPVVALLEKWSLPDDFARMAESFNDAAWQQPHYKAVAIDRRATQLLNSFGLYGRAVCY